MTAYQTSGVMTVGYMPRTEYVTPAEIFRGKLRVSNPQRWTAAMREFRDGAVLASVSRPRELRSAAANRLYWPAYVRPLCDATGNEPLVLHSYLKHRFLQPDTIVIVNADGEIVDEQSIDRPTTTTLTPSEFSNFLQAVEAFAAEIGVPVGRREHD